VASEEEKRTISTFIKEACQTAIDDVNEARQNGKKVAQDLVEPLHTHKSFDKLISSSASLMGQMTAGGVALLICPIKIVSKELKKK
jgi:light-regulated signal transduction histidine kinase (bacteriophytochrome)